MPLLVLQPAGVAGCGCFSEETRSQRLIRMARSLLQPVITTAHTTIHVSTLPPRSIGVPLPVKGAVASTTSSCSGGRNTCCARIQRSPRFFRCRSPWSMTEQKRRLKVLKLEAVCRWHVLPAMTPLRIPDPFVPPCYQFAPAGGADGSSRERLCALSGLTALGARPLLRVKYGKSVAF